MSTVLGLGAAFVGIGGGIGLIAVTENAGKRNDELANDQPCVVCKGVKVVPCTVCQGTGQDQFAQYVAAVQEEAGEVNDSGGSTVLVDDWDSGPKAVRNALPTSFPRHQSGCSRVHASCGSATHLPHLLNAHTSCSLLLW